jgi:hypothetical protein
MLQEFSRKVKAMAIQDEEFNLPILLGYWLCDCDPTAPIKAA